MVERRVPIPHRRVEPTRGDLENIGEIVPNQGTLDLDRIAAVPARDRDLAKKREPLVDVGNHVAHHLAHTEAFLAIQLGHQIVEVTEPHDPNEGVIERLAGEPHGGRKNYDEYA